MWGGRGEVEVGDRGFGLVFEFVTTGKCAECGSCGVGVNALSMCRRTDYETCKTSKCKDYQ